MTPKENYFQSLPKDTVILDEVLQRVEDPKAELLEAAKRGNVCVLVPNENAWSPELKPFTNALHKRVYDADSLTELLDECGLVYALKLLEFQNWSFLIAEGSAKA